MVTGTVAATMSAEGQAMVAGDAVNTAARVQSAATAGTVLVDTTTRRLAGLAIEFDLHGDVELKGKAEPETLWRAREIVSGVGGAQRSDGLEAPFVGRSVEFGLLKDVLHATKDQRAPAHGAGLRPRRGRQDAAGLGAGEVRRRAGRERLLAPRTLPDVR